MRFFVYAESFVDLNAIECRLINEGFKNYTLSTVQADFYPVGLSPAAISDCILLYRVTENLESKIDQFMKASFSKVLLLDCASSVGSKELAQLSLEDVAFGAKLRLALSSCRIENSQESILVRINSKLHKVDKCDILYLETQGKYLSIILENRTLLVRHSLRSIMNELPSYFVRVHTSFAINSYKIEYINLAENQVSINKGLIPVSRKYKEYLLSRFKIF